MRIAYRPDAVDHVERPGNDEEYRDEDCAANASHGVSFPHWWSCVAGHPDQPVRDERTAATLTGQPVNSAVRLWPSTDAKRAGPRRTALASRIPAPSRHRHVVGRTPVRTEGREA